MRWRLVLAMIAVPFGSWWGAAAMTGIGVSLVIAIGYVEPSRCSPGSGSGLLDPAMPPGARRDLRAAGMYS